MEENGENNYTLTIDNIKERNLGNYTCQAVNKIGDGSSTIALKGKDRRKCFNKNGLSYFNHNYMSAYLNVSYYKTNIIIFQEFRSI